MSRNGRQLESALAVINQRFNSARADYSATKISRFNPIRHGVPSQGAAGDYHLRNETDFYKLLENCYDLERNDSVVGQLIKRRVTNVVQDGFRLEPDTGDKAIDRDLKARWHDWANDPNQCDVAGESCFADFEYTAEWTHVLAGDCGISICDSGHLQFFEPYIIRRDRGGRGETFLGVDLTEERRRYRYWIAVADPNDPYETSWNEFAPIDTYDDFGNRQFCHVYDERRTTITRGVSAFTPIFELTGMLEDVNFAKLVQQQIVSCIAFLIEDQGSADGSLPATEEPKYGNPTQHRTENGERSYDEVEPGMEVKPGAGKKVSGFSPNIPNAEYFEQYRLILQLICGALDMPLSVGMMDGRDSTFHGFIGAANEAKKLWRRSQNNLGRKMHAPIYFGKLNHFCDEDRYLARAAARLGGRFFKHTWHKPVWQSVKNLEDTNDRLIRLQNSITSPSKIQNELNVDYESHVIETVNDNAFAIRVAKRRAAEINAEFQDGAPVTFRDLYAMPKAEGVQMTTTEEPVDEEPTPPIPSMNGSRFKISA